MFKFFISILLSFSLLFSQNTKAKSRVKLSKKYIPHGNPGGLSFYEDKGFVESYELYKKRRELLDKRNLQSTVSFNIKNINKKNLVEKLRKEKTTSSKRGLESKKDILFDKKDEMINHRGINITRLKEAIFIDQVQHIDQVQYKENERFKGTKEKEKEPSLGLDTKCTIKNCSDSFESIIDTVN